MCRRDAEQLKLQKKDILPLALLKLEFAEALIKKGKPTFVKRGRPSSSSSGNEPRIRPKSQQSSISDEIVRLD